MKVVLSLLHEMASCAARDLREIVEGRTSRDALHADMRAYANAIPAVLRTTVEHDAFFGADQVEEAIDAVLSRYPLER